MTEINHFLAGLLYRSCLSFTPSIFCITWSENKKGSYKEYS